MAVSTIRPGGALPVHIQELKQQMAELQVQLGTGRKATTYGGIGSGRSLALELRGQIARIESYMTTITLVDLRLNVMDGALSGMQDVVGTLHGAWLIAPYETGSDGRTQIQHTAEAGLSQLVQLLNSEVNGRYLFAGRDSETRPVASDRAILEGEGARAGLRQVVSERAAADLGSDGLGRLAVPAAVGSAASVAEDAAGHPFGFKLAGVTSSLTGTSVTGPAGAPATIDVVFSATLPVGGEEIAIQVALPDGTSREIRLVATTAVPPGAGGFTIGADENTTAANFETALRTEIGRVAAIELRAASAVQAANEFFDFDAATPPQRVAGPPFDSATSVVDATAADTVFWYRGDLVTPARESALARVDEGRTIGYGARADEAALRNAVKQVALIAVSRFDASLGTDQERYEALKARGLPALSGGAGAAAVSDVATELAHRHIAINAARDRHRETLAFAEGTLDATEGVDLEETGVRFLRLQTQLQASFETTAILARLTLVNFL